MATTNVEDSSGTSLPPDAASGTATGDSSTGSSSSTGATGSGTPNPVTKWEDDPRAKGILADLRREREARHQSDRRVAEAEARAVERDRQIAALTNARPPSEQEADADAIRERFNQLYPHLGDLTADDVMALREMVAQRDQLAQTVQHHWTEHSKRMLNSVYGKLETELGTLTERQKHKIAALYVAEAEGTEGFLARHDTGDPALVEEFVKSYLEDTVDPVRRRTTMNELGRQRTVPRGGDRDIPPTGGKPIDVKDDKAVMDFLMESRKGRFNR